MTSSLVGSEMCIRDSSEANPGDKSRHTSLDILSHPGARRRGRAASACLLYTSDAADECSV
eukprot:470814-Prorocentrum_lima.AAC.1